MGYQARWDVDCCPVMAQPSALEARLSDIDSSSLEPELPEYSSLSSSVTPTNAAPRESRTHTFELLNSQGHPWVKLHVQSKASPTAQLPTITEGEAVAGSVESDMPKEKAIKSVTIVVLGELLTTRGAQCTFVQVTEQLWTPVHGDPREAVSGSNLAHFKGKLYGRFTFPFSLRLPEGTEVKSRDGTTKSTRLPSSLFTKSSTVTVNYRVYVSIERGTFDTGHKLGTNIYYLALIKPSPASIARQLAYQENSPLIGPDGDPEGWHTLSSVTIHGKLFNSRDIEAKYTLSLAKPLSYTRGSVIPLHLVIECDDQQGLDVLSVPRAPSVYLQQFIAVTFSVEGLRAGTGSPIRFRKPDPSQDTSFKDVTSCCLVAICVSKYKLGCSKQEGNIGRLNIHKLTNPSATLGDYCNKYEVVMYNPELTGFQPDGGVKVILEGIPVTIATAYASGPRPRSYAPPDYSALPGATPGPEQARHGIAENRSGLEAWGYM